ncbi:MAG: DNA repair protein RecO C-terminal domain-containing protein [Bacteroidaceae bacterium]|nr:DNA repair protein RecO C-terminal domain-containing protein [Bacteroidaceae bacterium]
MLFRSRAIVLQTLRYADDKLVCRLLTEREGCVSFLVRRGTGRGSRHRLFRPLALLDVEWSKPRDGALAYPKNVAAALNYATIPYDTSKTAVALFLCEFLQSAVRSEPPSPALFAFVEQSLRFYDRLERGHANFHLVFLLQLATFLGLSPDVGGFRPGAFFDLREGGFTAMRPLHPQYAEPEEAAALPVLMRMSYANMHRFRLSGRERSRLLAHLCDYYRLHIPAFPELKSLGILGEVFAAEREN